MRDLSSAIEQFLQSCRQDDRQVPPDDFKPLPACPVREHVQKWIVFLEKVFAFSEEQPPTQMILDARSWVRAGLNQLRSLAWCMDQSSKGYAYDLDYIVRSEILKPAATVALMMLALAGRRLTWMKGEGRFCDAFMEAMDPSPLRALPPPLKPNRETTLKFVRALAPDVMRIYLDEGGTIRGQRRARRR
jgi:hypothetical protein